MKVCLIGFGEVGRALYVELARAGAVVSAWDITFADPASGPSSALAGSQLGPATDLRTALRGATLVICAVRAAQCVAAAQACADAIEPAALSWTSTLPRQRPNESPPRPSQRVAAVTSRPL